MNMLVTSLLLDLAFAYVTGFAAYVQRRLAVPGWWPRALELCAAASLLVAVWDLYRLLSFFSTT